MNLDWIDNRRINPNPRHKMNHENSLWINLIIDSNSSIFGTEYLNIERLGVKYERI